MRDLTIIWKCKGWEFKWDKLYPIFLNTDDINKNGIYKVSIWCNATLLFSNKQFFVTHLLIHVNYSYYYLVSIWQSILYLPLSISDVNNYCFLLTTSIFLGKLFNSSDEGDQLQ
jgi:hypothetical protein